MSSLWTLCYYNLFRNNNLLKNKKKKLTLKYTNNRNKGILI